MAYELEEWDYNDEESFNKAMEHFKHNRRLIMLIDRDKDKSFIIIGDCQNKENDMAQGRILRDVVNSPSFPRD